MPKLLRTTCLIGLLACGSRGAPPPVEPAAPARAPTPALALPAGVLAPRGTLLLGDLHGTREIPAFVGQTVAAVAAREPVVLGLEIVADQVPSLEGFLASDGGPAARAAALRDPWWTAAYQDGRRSVAMLDLLDAVRQQRARGARIDVVCFDAEARGPDGGPDRDAAMAANLAAVRAARPDASLVIYAGNAHTRRAAIPREPDHAWMAMLLARAGVAFVTLNAHYSEGSAWICQGSGPAGCGPTMLGRPADASGVHLEPGTEGAYDGWFGVGAITASPPAAFPALADGLDARLAALRAANAGRRRANAAYGAKQYRACADEYARLAPPSAADVYNQACCLALAGDKDAAFDRLRAAIGLGFRDLAGAATDADLAALHDDPRWPATIKP